MIKPLIIDDIAYYLDNATGNVYSIADDFTIETHSTPAILYSYLAKTYEHVTAEMKERRYYDGQTFTKMVFSEDISTSINIIYCENFTYAEQLLAIAEIYQAKHNAICDLESAFDMFVDNNALKFNCDGDGESRLISSQPTPDGALLAYNALRVARANYGEF
ncbi:hypothetical protein HNP86_001843 [Methanococcus maripaludis]|uniref:Uncharacterized protein n=1 Tax=Methanococcus maripaludis TaxID=39152 RepID=A0A7J9NWP4_METMI|nr:hypothetical protein [Methanococcus maripaludis]MBA2851684.1 hypothetical protein [Methanococcus maripaludis]